MFNMSIRLKRGIVIAATAVMALGLGACAGDDDGDNGGGDDTTTTAAP